MSDAIDLGDVDAFTTGTVGRPGQRTFFLQARTGTQVVTVKCEKAQVAALAQYLDKVLADLPVPEDRPMAEQLALRTPVETAFVLGPIAVGLDPRDDRVVLQLEELVPTDEEGEPDPVAEAVKATLRVQLTRGQARAFCDHAEEVVQAGRPSCRFCGHPMDPDGHICPRMN